MRGLRFAGYAAIFDKIDKGGDIIRLGAFGPWEDRQTLPLLWQHAPDQKIGDIHYVQEDRKGLRVIGSISACTKAGMEASAMLKNGTVRGLSFGYRVKKSAGQRPRELLDLDVAEISLVTFPMQEGAGVISYKIE